MSKRADPPTELISKTEEKERESSDFTPADKAAESKVIFKLKEKTQEQKADNETHKEEEEKASKVPESEKQESKAFKLKDEPAEQTGLFGKFTPINSLFNDSKGDEKPLFGSLSGSQNPFSSLFSGSQQNSLFGKNASLIGNKPSLFGNGTGSGSLFGSGAGLTGSGSLFGSGAGFTGSGVLSKAVHDSGDSENDQGEEGGADQDNQRKEESDSEEANKLLENEEEKSPYERLISKNLTNIRVEGLDPFGPGSLSIEQLKDAEARKASTLNGYPLVIFRNKAKKVLFNGFIIQGLSTSCFLKNRKDSISVFAYQLVMPEDNEEEEKTENGEEKKEAKKASLQKKTLKFCFTSDSDASEFKDIFDSKSAKA